MLSFFWKLFIVGWVVLIAAILANLLAAMLGLKSWYDFIALFNEHGKRGFSMLNFFDYVWLFLLYPSLLGGAAVLIFRFLKSF